MDAQLASLRNENRELVARNADLQAVVYALAHDLGAPLRAIEGSAALLLDDLGHLPDTQVDRNLGRIQGGVARARGMIQGLMQLLRTDRLRVVDRANVDMTEVARCVVQDLRVAEPQRAVNVRVMRNMAAVADVRLVVLVVQNLLGNAWKFTRERADALVEFGAECRCGDTVYFVRDNGVGFDPAHSQALFAPFQRLHAATEFAGHGLGLAIARRIVELHGGRIWAEGKPGAGAVFRFTLAHTADSSEESVRIVRRSQTLG